MSGVSLCMIVKDESRVIERCLRSVLPWISAWTVVDTGSSDNTPQIVESLLGHLPGQVHHRPWRNFAENRSEAFTLNRHLGEYHLVIDADDWLEAESDFRMPALQADCYWLSVCYGGIRYSRPQLFRAALDWRYQGVVHEYAECADAVHSGSLRGLTYVCSSGQGARSGDAQKYLHDAHLLETVLQAEPDHPRNWFYLGQSYRDAGLLEQAARAYDRRLLLEGWTEERYVARLERARLGIRLDEPQNEIRAHLLDALQLNPARAEGVVELARLHRLSGHWNLAYFFAAAAVQLDMPQDGLFLEESCYGWRALDELALAQFYTGRNAGALRTTQMALEAAPVDQLPRLRRNLWHCRRRCEGVRNFATL